MATPTIRLRTLSGPGLVIYSVISTFAFVDWIMSIDPRWSSTVFPLIVLIGQVLTAFSFVVVLLAGFRHFFPFDRLATPKCFLDLGNLLLTFVMFWTYIAFAQFLIIYSGNLPREIRWYLPRIHDGWKWIPCLLGLFHFLIPFFLLLFRSNKTQVPRLAAIAVLILGAHALASFWLVVPPGRQSGTYLHLSDLAAFIGIGGFWVAGFARSLQQHALLPGNDPRFESLPCPPAHAS